MKAPTDNQLKQAIKMHADGKKMMDIIDATGLNYSQAWLAIRDHEIEDNLRVKGDKRTAQRVQQLRMQGCSWGEISVRFDYHEFPESKIRRMFKEASGMESVGLRVGRGGRFLLGEPEFYQDEHRKPGFEFEAGTARSDMRVVAASLREGNKAHGARKSVAKKAAKASGAVKSAKKTAKKVAKKAAPKQTEQVDESADPFES